MARFITERLFKAALILLCIAILNFFLIRAAPRRSGNDYGWRVGSGG